MSAMSNVPIRFQPKQDVGHFLITIILSSCYFCWRSEKKKNVIHEKVITENKCLKNKAEEERYLKEERDKMALEVYENWLVSPPSHLGH